MELIYCQLLLAIVEWNLQDCKLELKFTVRLGFWCVSALSCTLYRLRMWDSVKESEGNFCRHSPHRPAEIHPVSRPSPAVHAACCCQRSWHHARTLASVRQCCGWRASHYKPLARWGRRTLYDFCSVPPDRLPGSLWGYGYNLAHRWSCFKYKHRCPICNS